MAPAEDNDSGMESQEGSQSVDVDLEKEPQDVSETKEAPTKKQPAIEPSEEDDEVMLRYFHSHLEFIINF